MEEGKIKKKNCVQILVMMIDVVMNDLFIQSRSSRCCLAWGLIILKSQIADVYLLLWSLWMDTL